MGYQNDDQVTNDFLRAARRDAADEYHKAGRNQYGYQTPAVVTAPSFASYVAYQTEDMAVKQAAERAYMDTLHLVDISHIPFPDSPPIVYPDAAFWRKISKERKEKYSSVDLSTTNPTEQRILTTISEQRTSVDVADQPLSEWATYLSDKYHIPIMFDTAALRDATIDPSTTPVGIVVKDISLRSALKLVLGEHNLTYVVKDEVLMITTTDKANAQLVTKVYPVADLVLPIQTIQPNSGQLGGGIGGGSMSFGGGFGGGGGGGGLGGGGGGFGGGGGGLGGFGGGGGGFNLPRERGRMILPPRNSTGAFDVGDTEGSAPKVQKTGIKLQDSSVKNQGSAPNSAVSATSAPSKPSATNRSSMATPIAVKSDVNPEKLWNDYFAKLPEPDADRAESVMRQRGETIRATSKELMAQRKFDQVTALLNAALRNGYTQPWMYEGLALALQAQKAPPEEIERALMSAVDFAKSSTDLMNVAIYMARVGLDARALKLLRQASAMEPFRHEPYMHGLKIAQRLNDNAGIRWACLGVLSQAWPNDKKEVVDSAQFAAGALLDTLQHDGNKSAADEFKTALDKARQRDCRVEVRWSGNADIDLAVEEPTGAVCSLRAAQRRRRCDARRYLCQIEIE